MDESIHPQPAETTASDPAGPPPSLKDELGPDTPILDKRAVLVGLIICALLAAGAAMAMGLLPMTGVVPPGGGITLRLALVWTRPM